MSYIKATIPSELKRKVSPAMLWFSGVQGIFTRVVFIGLDALFLYEGSGRNIFMYLVGACTCPAAVAVLYSFVPFRPYRGVFYQKNVHDVDRKDPVVMRLVELFRSKEARSHIWRQSAKLTAILLVILGTATMFFRAPGTWSFSLLSPQCWICFVLGFVGCFTFLSGDHADWALTTWARREAGHEPA